MVEWHPTKLDDLIEVRHGFAFKGEYFVNEPPGDLLVTPGNFAIGGGFQWGRAKFYRGGPVPEEYVLAPGDLLVTMTDLSKGADTLGYSAVVPQNRIRMLHNQRIGKVRLKNSLADQGFINWLLRSPEYRNEILASYTGSTVKHTSPTKICAYEFLLPPVSEQRAIAAILGNLDDKIDLNRQMNETLEEMARAIFKDWFVDFGPTRAKIEGREPFFAPEIWDIFPDNMDDEEKPEGWEFSTIGNEVEVFGGSTPSTKDAAFWNGDVNWATPKDLSALTVPVLLDTKRQITDAGLAKISSGLLPVGTVLLSSRAPIGYLAITEVPTAVNQGFIAMICNRRISNTFAWLWCVSNMDAILDNANGSTFQEISKRNFRPIPATIATDDVHEAFDALVRPLYLRIVANERESRALAQARDLLLPKLMSGDLRLSVKRTQQ